MIETKYALPNVLCITALLLVWSVGHMDLHITYSVSKPSKFSESFKW